MIGSRKTPMFPGHASTYTPPIAPETIGTTADLPAMIGAMRRPTDRPAWAGDDPGIYKPGLAGVGQKIGDWLHAPGTAATLFRSGAATLQGGLGAGLAAGANYADGQKAAEAKAGQQEFENQLEVLRQAVQQQQADQTGSYQDGSLRHDAYRIDETMRSNRAREGIDANGQRINLYGIQSRDATARRGQDVQVMTNAEDNRTSRQNNQATVGATIYGVDATNYRAGQEAAGIGSKNTGYTETQTKSEATPERSHWFAPNEPAVPETVTTTRVPVVPGANEIRYDGAGNAYRRDPATGQPVRVR